ncbi:MULTISPECIES: hypothetical protein [Actinomyces]|uniref:hypothetical protein n=1 Tax=Actinomyces TaxID=1654 RepID=UPI0005BE2D08|nr:MULTISPECIES: hypothetical protein [Actinomyces]
MPRPSAFARLGASAGLVVLATGCTTTAAEETDTAPPTPSASDTTPTTDSTAGSSSVGAATGEYSATGTYTGPGGTQTVEVDLTVEDGTITAVTVTPGAVDSQSLRYEEDFADHVAEQVVGKSLDEVSVGTVASSSLTGQGFNDALDQIREQVGG